MIIDLEQFILSERPYWEELDKTLDGFEDRSRAAADIEEIQRFHYLYERTSADLVKLKTFASERETRTYLESLVARAYGHIHETRRKPHRLRPVHWFFTVFPRTFRRHKGAFCASTSITAIGCLLGAVLLLMDPRARDVLLPYQHSFRGPEQRVEAEESARHNPVGGAQTRMASFYMTHNTRVAIYTMVAGITWGIGTILLLFQNGMMIGAISADYAAAGQTEFLVSWLLPHGSVEIPALLLAGQTGMMLASAMIGWGTSRKLGSRLREITPDLVTMIAGIAVLLVWAGLIEAYLSQHHEPTIPYALKIGFGIFQLALVTLFLSRAGRRKEKD